MKSARWIVAVGLLGCAIAQASTRVLDGFDDPSRWRLQASEGAQARLTRVSGADVFAVKVEQSGGPFNALRVAAIADAAGIGLYGGTMLEGAVGTIVSAHAFATFANLQWGTELFGPLLLTEEILRTPLDYSDFELTVPTGPGLGIELDEDRVAFLSRNGLRKTISVAL